MSAAREASMGQVKVTVNLHEDVVKALEALAKKRGVTMTEVINRAIVDEKYFDDAVSEGRRILLLEKNDQMTEVIFHR
jgi:hypothetical protein